MSCHSHAALDKPHYHWRTVGCNNAGPKHLTKDDVEVVEFLSDHNLQIMSDFALPEGYVPFGDERDMSARVPCYYVGWPDEPGAGIRGGCIGPTFTDDKELVRWVSEHRKEIIGSLAI